MTAGFRPFHDMYASQGPLLLDLSYLFFQAFGQTVLAARIPVLVASLASLTVVYFIAS